MVYSRLKIGVNAVLWGAVLFCTVFSVHAAEIRLKNVPIQLTGTLVTLADIADVSPMGDENVESFRQVVLFPAPADGETRTLDQWELRTMLSQLGINSLHHSISGAEKVTIIGVAASNTMRMNPNEQFVVQANHLTPTGLTLTGTSLIAPNAVRSEVSPPVSGLTDDIARLLEGQVAQALRIYLNFTNKIERSWDISLKLTPEHFRLFASNGQIAEITGGQIPFTGVQQFHIRMQNNVTITVDAMVELPLEAVVARRTLPKGHIINESDVMLRRADRVTGDDFFVDIKSVVGREVIKPVKDLAVLTQSSIRAPLWVRRGEIVTVRAAKNGLVVRTEATALQDGVEGDTISVSKIDTETSRRGGKKEEPVTYLVRVCAPKTVEVFVK